MAETIPEPVRKFVAAHVRSIAQLEALLLLRARPEQELSLNEVARELYCQPEIIGRQLAELEAAGLLQVMPGGEPRYCYRPRADELRQTVDELAMIYRDRRVAVTTLIYSDSTYAMRSFADAFRLRRDSQ